MIKEVDELLKELNSENYDAQFLWNNENDIRNDVIEYFKLDEADDIEEINGWVKYGNGEFVYSSSANDLMTLEEAINNELSNSIYSIESFNRDLQEQILKANFRDVIEINYKIPNFDKVKEWAFNDNPNIKNSNEAIWYYISEKEREFINDLEQKYNLDYAEDTTETGFFTNDTDGYYVEFSFLVTNK